MEGGKINTRTKSLFSTKERGLLSGGRDSQRGVFTSAGKIWNGERRESHFNKKGRPKGEMRKKWAHKLLIPRGKRRTDAARRRKENFPARAGRRETPRPKKEVAS